MSVVGKMELGLAVNTTPFIDGWKAGESAAKKSAAGISSSFEKINKAQMSSVGATMFRNFIGPTALASAGADLATDLIKGFSTGRYKNWEEAGQGLMTALKTGIESIPIAGSFAKLGGAIGDAVFGVDAATKSLAETNKQLAVTDELVKMLKSRSDLSMNAEQELQKKISDIGRTSHEKDLEEYKKSLAAKDEVTLDSIMKQYDSQKKVLAKPVREVIYTEHGEQYSESQEEFAKRELKYQEAIAQAVIDRASAEKLRREELERDSALKVENLANLQKEYDLNTQIENDNIAYTAKRQTVENTLVDLEEQARQLGMSERDILLEKLSLLPEITDAEIDRGMAAFDAGKAYKQQQVALKRIKDEQQEIADIQTKAQNDLNDAAIAYGKEEDRLNKQAETASSATTLDTAIGAVKIEGATDFSIEKQLETAKDQLEAAETSVEYLKVIAGQLGGSV